MPPFHPVSPDQPDLIEDDQHAQHSHAASSDLNAEPAADAVPNGDSQLKDGIKVDGVDVPRSVVEHIDMLLLRITSLEVRLRHLEDGQVVEQPRQEFELERVMAVPTIEDFKDEEDHKTPLPSIFEPVERNLGRWQVVRVHEPAQLPADNDHGIADCVFYVGLSIALGVTAYKILGHYW